MAETMYTFHAWTSHGLDLPSAIASIGGFLPDAESFAIVYTPDRCFMAEVRGGQLVGPPGQPVDPSGIFEARVFNSQLELRWVKDPRQAAHRASLLTTGQAVRPDTSQGWNKLPDVPLEGVLHQTYVLWGEGTGQSLGQGWSLLGLARIGSLPVPVRNVAPRQRVLLRTRELLARREDGNVRVFDEMLVGFDLLSRDGGA